MGKIYEALLEAEKRRGNLKVVIGTPEAVPYPREAIPAPATPPAPEVEAGPAGETPPATLFKPVPEGTPTAIPKEKPLPLLPGLKAEKEMATLYQNIEALVGQTRRKIIQFVGCNPGEGTSTIARDFARYSAARLGKKVLFVEGDPDNPIPLLSWGIPAAYSLEEAVRDGGQVERAFFRDRRSGLTVGLAAREDATLLHFLESEGHAPLWESLRESFELVVVDAPPLSASAVGLAFCRRADGVILVLEADRTRGPVAEKAKEHIQQSGGNILGVVFNKRKFYIPKSIYKRL